MQFEIALQSSLHDFWSSWITMILIQLSGNSLFLDLGHSNHDFQGLQTKKKKSVENGLVRSFILFFVIGLSLCILISNHLFNVTFHSNDNVFHTMN